jgi:hypothetical protein
MFNPGENVAVPGEDGGPVLTNAVLTDNGFKTLADAAPGHVAHVRSLVIDVLSPEQLRRLGRDANRIMSSIEDALTIRLAARGSD